MTYKKTVLSYLLWAVYTCTAGIMLADYAILFWQKNINTVIGYGTAAFVFCVFAAVLGIYFLIRKALFVISKGGTRKLIRRRTAVLAETAVVFAVFFAGLSYRIYLYMQSNMDTVILTHYYEQAVVKSGGGVEAMLHGASYLYTMCLSFAFSFLGNKAASAVILQIFLQMCAILFAYLAVRKVAGRIPACVTMFVLAFSSIYIEQIFQITPESLFFVLYLAGLCIIGNYVKNYCSIRMHKTSAVTGAVLAGFCIGVMIYLDAVSVTLLFFAIGLFTGTRLWTNQEIPGKQSKEACRFNSPDKAAVILFILVIVSAGLALLGMFALDAFYGCGNITGAVDAWLTLYLSYLPIDYIFYQTGISMIESLVLVVFAAFLIMSFWNRPKIQNAAPWMCLLLILAPTPLATVGVLPYQVFSVFLWSVLAGIGLQQTLVTPAKGKAVTVPEAGGLIERQDAAETMAEPETVPAEEPSTEKEEKTDMTEPAETLEHTAPRFIKNPLPLPKKHEKKEMGYRYEEIAEDMLEFDIEVAEDDDFDIP